MIDAHCHPGAPTSPDVARRCVCAAAPADWPALEALRAGDVAFYGVHPWHAAEFDAPALRAALAAHPKAGVGEIGLDRLKARAVPSEARAAFAAQLAIAAELRRPVVLHGAKCWGEVVKACAPCAGRVPAFLFHGFSRSDGLLPQMVALNGYVSVGAAVLNDHAVNYRALVKKLPADRILVETDEAGGDALAAIVAKTAELRGLAADAFAAQTERNAEAWLNTL